MAIEPLQTESDLIRRFRTGDEEAFRILMSHCKSDLQARIESRLSKALKRRISVSDVLQEARIAAFRRRHSLKDRGSGTFRKWLLGIVDLEIRYVIKRHVRAEKRSLKQEVTRSCRMDTAMYPGKITTPSQAAIGRELGEIAKRAMAELPEDYRKVLHLARMERLNLIEISKRMGSSHDAARKRYSRALMAFAKTFKKMGGGGHAG